MRPASSSVYPYASRLFTAAVRILLCNGFIKGFAGERIGPETHSQYLNCGQVEVLSPYPGDRQIRKYRRQEHKQWTKRN